MNKAEAIKNLKKLTSPPEALEKDFWSAPSFAPGIAKGSLVELMGNARTEWLLELFRLHQDALIFWCEKESSVNPTAIHQRGIALERIKFITSTAHLQQSLRLALQSGQYPFVVAPAAFEEVRVFQRLQLLAEKSKSTLFLLAKEKFSAAWPISLQMDIHFSTDGMDITVARQKHGIQGRQECQEFQK